jgi:hypothetical protein
LRHVNFETKGKKKRIRSKEVYYSICRWWEEVLLQGSQLLYCEHNEDEYKGEGPWYDRVAILALMSECVNCPLCIIKDITYYEFYRHFTRINSPLYDKYKAKRVIWNGNEVMGVKVISYVIFSDLERHRELFHDRIIAQRG